jgi:hypothetical protein
MGMSFGSVGCAGAGVACHPIYPPRHLFVPDICPPGTRKLLFSRRTKHRFAQVTDQSDRQEQRLVLAIRTSKPKLSRSDFTQDRSLAIHGEWHERTDVEKVIQSAILVRLENGRQGAALGAQL